MHTRPTSENFVDSARVPRERQGLRSRGRDPGLAWGLKDPTEIERQGAARATRCATYADVLRVEASVAHAIDVQLTRARVASVFAPGLGKRSLIFRQVVARAPGGRLW